MKGFLMERSFDVGLQGEVKPKGPAKKVRPWHHVGKQERLEIPWVKEPRVVVHCGNDKVTTKAMCF